MTEYITDVDIRNALWDACRLTKCISKTSGRLPSDYKNKAEYQSAMFTGEVFSYSGGKGNIDAGLIGITKFGIVIAFRGTSGQDDWINDLKAAHVPSPYSAGKVHRGFLTSTQNLENNIVNKLCELEGQNLHARIYFAGHSKGGALATLMPLSALQKFSLSSHRITVYSFGSPKVGDQEFSDAYALKHKRYESFLDLVPHLPFSKEEETLFIRCGTLMEKYDELQEFLNLPPYTHVGQRIAFKQESPETKKYLNLPMESDCAKETLNSFASVTRLIAGLEKDLIENIHCNDYDNIPDDMG